MTPPLAIDDTLRFRGIGHVAVSPDGERIAFIQAEFDLAADETVWSIWLVASDGSEAPLRLTSGRRDSKPAWAPDGKTIAFLSAREQPWRQDLYVVDPDGGDARVAAVLPRGIEGFAWSPEGDGFALAGRPAYPDDPRRPAPADDSERRRRYLDRVVHVDGFEYRSPSAFTDDEAAQIWWSPLDGAPTMLTSGPDETADPKWMPDGRIAFRSSDTAEATRESWTAIRAIARQGGAAEDLTETVNHLRGFAPQTDGGIAYLGLPIKEWSFGSHDVQLFAGGSPVTAGLDRPAGRMSEVQSLTVDYLSSTEGPVPGPGGALYFHVVDAGSAHIYRWAGGEPEPVVTGDRVIGDLSLGGDTLAFTASSANEPIALWVTDPEGGAERLVYDPNPWVAECGVGEIRTLSIPLEDGTAMDAWAVLPADYEGGALPAILDVHPGPHSSFPRDYRWDQRIIANAGYVVLSCNQPGSQGYGEVFAQVLDRAWGEADMPAYLALCDEAVRLGLADDERIGITGATYGGYVCLWALAHTDRFKAAVANRAITHLEAMYGDSDIGWAFLPASLGAEPWEDPELYRRLSPVTYVEQIKAPIRFLTFAGNNRITVSASENVYLRLRKLGVETDLLVFPPGSSTVVMPGRPWSKIDLLEATVGWFDRHLS